MTGWPGLGRASAVIGVVFAVVSLAAPWGPVWAVAVAAGAGFVGSGWLLGRQEPVVVPLVMTAPPTLELPVAVPVRRVRALFPADGDRGASLNVVSGRGQLPLTQATRGNTLVSDRMHIIHESTMQVPCP